MDLIKMIVGLIEDIFNALLSAAEAVTDFHFQLENFDQKILLMNEAAKNGEVAGLPINGAIATLHYLFGDVVFNMFYFMILFGCMFTIYQLCLLIYSAFCTAKNDLTSGSFTKAGLLGKLGKLIKVK